MNGDSGQQSAVTWRELREFRAIHLDASYILSWSLEAECLQLELDAALAPEHPLYEKPRPSQARCLRAAVIEFPFVEKLTTAIDGATSSATTDRLALLKPGLLSSMVVREEGHYVLGGEFGTVSFKSERPVLRILAH